MKTAKLDSSKTSLYAVSRLIFNSVHCVQSLIGTLINNLLPRTLQLCTRQPGLSTHTTASKITPESMAEITMRMTIIAPNILASSLSMKLFKARLFKIGSVSFSTLVLISWSIRSPTSVEIYLALEVWIVLNNEQLITNDAGISF